MNNTVITGRMYNGAVHGWTDKSNKQKIERTCFRGRLNFRLQSGDYAWMDAVCFRDNPNTDQNGLVGWLEENYLAPEDQADGHGGRAIEVVGHLKPTEKFKTHTVRIKGGGSKDIPDVPYETFELVIESAYFVPTSQGDDSGRGGRGNSRTDEDFDLEDEDQDDDGFDLDDDEEEEAPRRGNSNNGRGNSGSRSNSSSTARSSTGNRSSSNSGSSRSERRGNNSSSTARSGNGGNRGSSNSSNSNRNSSSTGSNKSKGGNRNKSGNGKSDPFFKD